MTGFQSQNDVQSELFPPEWRRGAAYAARLGAACRLMALRVGSVVRLGREDRLLGRVRAAGHLESAAFAGTLALKVVAGRLGYSVNFVETLNLPEFLRPASLEFSEGQRRAGLVKAGVVGRFGLVG